MTWTALTMPVANKDLDAAITLIIRDEADQIFGAKDPRSTGEMADYLLPDAGTLEDKIARQRIFAALIRIARKPTAHGGLAIRGEPVAYRYGLKRPWLWSRPAPARPSDYALAAAIVDAYGDRSNAITAWARWVLAHAATTKVPDPRP